MHHHRRHPLHPLLEPPPLCRCLPSRPAQDAHRPQATWNALGAAGAGRIPKSAGLGCAARGCQWCGPARPVSCCPAPPTPGAGSAPASAPAAAPPAAAPCRGAQSSAGRERRRRRRGRAMPRAPRWRLRRAGAAGSRSSCAAPARHAARRPAAGRTPAPWPRRTARSARPVCACGRSLRLPSSAARACAAARPSLATQAAPPPPAAAPPPARPACAAARPAPRCPPPSHRRRPSSRGVRHPPRASRCRPPLCPQEAAAVAEGAALLLPPPYAVLSRSTHCCRCLHRHHRHRHHHRCRRQPASPCSWRAWCLLPMKYRY
eukprot:Rhum_TRINITY_DN8121_c0_g1::Rhum_TRINITY_DN8121_c0_g1_i1::g.26333::m.26333